MHVEQRRCLRSRSRLGIGGQRPRRSQAGSSSGQTRPTRGKRPSVAIGQRAKPSHGRVKPSDPGRCHGRPSASRGPSVIVWPCRAAALQTITSGSPLTPSLTAVAGAPYGRRAVQPAAPTGLRGMGAMATSTQRDEDREQREQARAEKLEALHQTLTAQVAELADSEAWQAMLRAAARFHRYSFGNVCMILAQRPTATRGGGIPDLAAASAGASPRVRRASRFWRPSPTRPSRPRNRTTARTSQHDEKPDATGARRLHGFKVEYALRHRADPRRAAARRDPVRARGRRSRRSVGRARVPGRRRGLPAPPRRVRAANRQRRDRPMTKTVTVRADLPPAQACKTLAHELAHIRLGHVTGLPSSSGCRGRRPRLRPRASPSW